MLPSVGWAYKLTPRVRECLARLLAGPSRGLFIPRRGRMPYAGSTKLNWRHHLAAPFVVLVTLSPVLVAAYLIVSFPPWLLWKLADRFGRREYR